MSIEVVVQTTVATPGHRAEERHPAVVLIKQPNTCNGHRRPRVYANWVGRPQNMPTGYRVPQRPKHEHPRPVPVEAIWKCNCGQPFATYQYLMHHVIEIHPHSDEHYPL
jgi:hypothetical protein